MTDTVVEQPHVTAGFEFKKPNGVKYSGETASIYIPLAVDPTDSADVLYAAQRAIETAKQVVYEALGVEYEVKYDALGMERAVALLAETFGPGVVVEPFGDSDSGPATRRPAVSNRKVTVLKPLDDDHPDWLDAEWQRLVDDGKVDPDHNEVWDNRKFLPEFGGKSSPKGPWYRVSKGDKAGIWPPKGAR